MINLNKKDLISINQSIGENGEFQNESSLDFALSMTKQKKSWLYELAYLLRCLLVDHAFQDGNKRTALGISILYLEDKSIEFQKEKLVETMHQIAKNNYKSVAKITRLIKNATLS